MTRKLRDDCFLHDSDRLTHDEAVAILRERMARVVEAEQVPVDEASIFQPTTMQRLMAMHLPSPTMTPRKAAP